MAGMLALADQHAVVFAPKRRWLMATGLRGAGILTEGAMIVGIGMAGAPIMGLPQSPLPEPAAVGVAYVALLLLQGGGVHDQRQRVGLAVRALACTFVCMALIVSRG